MENIIFAVLVLGAIAIVFGLILSVAAKVFEVKVDERLPKIQECLAGANCGGCGYPGCAGCAEADPSPARLPSPPARPPARRALPRSPRSWAWKRPAVRRWSLMSSATAAMPL